MMRTSLSLLSDLLWVFCRSHSIWYPAICRTEVLCIWDTQGELFCWGRTTFECQASLWGCGWCCGPNRYLPFGCCAAANAGNVLPVSFASCKKSLDYLTLACFGFDNYFYNWRCRELVIGVWNQLLCFILLTANYFWNSQVQSENALVGAQYKGTLDGLICIAERQGWKQLFAGLGINYLKVTTCLLSYIYLWFSSFYALRLARF
jgi:hypothetical protein